MLTRRYTRRPSCGADGLDAEQALRRSCPLRRATHDATGAPSAVRNWCHRGTTRRLAGRVTSCGETRTDGRTPTQPVSRARHAGAPTACRTDRLKWPESEWDEDTRRACHRQHQQQYSRRRLVDVLNTRSLGFYCAQNILTFILVAE